MSCCNQKRAAAIASASPPRPARTQRAEPAPPQPARQLSRTTVRYVGVQPVRVRGTASGRVHQCSAASRVLLVDTRDVAALVRTGLFTT